MTSVTTTETHFAATPAIAQHQTHRPHRLIRLTDATVAAFLAIRGFVSSVVRAPVLLPIEAAMLEASVLVALLDGHADEQSDLMVGHADEQSDTFAWIMPIDVWHPHRRA